jgi:hypothetical protein
VQQIGYGAERGRCNCLTRRGGIQVGPGGWDERAGPVGQNQDEVQLAVAPHPAKQRQYLTFQRVAGSNNTDLSRVALEVGSMLPFRSILFRMSLFCVRSDDTPTSGGSCCMWNAG